ncbi:MAG TPA: three-Cys-motif partner protein TcmP [Chthoniobacterales bacterium]|jgi:three-Cys-motif partner protein|nr:three-Cys-motif partner protein TcmP [Chthoniobacterales bacterium]
MDDRLDLRQQAHDECLGCTRDDREQTDSDGLCVNFVSKLDGLPLRAVGEWSYDKIYRLVKYVGIFAGGMKNLWDSLNYIEIGSGPGRCIVRDDCTEMDGTPLAVLRNRQSSFFENAIFIDASSRVVEVLNLRIAALNAAKFANAVAGDYSDARGLCRIVSHLSPRSLNLIFIDPTECDVPFETIEQVVTHLRNADLLINVAIGTDVNRNIAAAILETTHSRAREKYERFLGNQGFCSRSDVITMAKNGDHEALRRSFAKAYSAKLAKLGYLHTDVRAVRHYYHLLFASRHRRGLEFWRSSCKIAPDRQRELF